MPDAQKRRTNWFKWVAIVFSPTAVVGFWGLLLIGYTLNIAQERMAAMPPNSYGQYPAILKMPETYGLINAVVAFVSSSLAGLLLLLAVGGLTFKIGYASAAKLGSAIKYDLWLALFTACFIFVIGWWVAGLFGMFLADPKVLMAFAPATVAAFGHPEMPPLVNMTWFRGAAIALNVIFAGWISKRLKEKLEAEPDE